MQEVAFTFWWCCRFRAISPNLDDSNISDEACHFDQFEKERKLVTNNPNELTIENSVLVLIDHQPRVAFAVQSIDRGIATTLARVLHRTGPRAATQRNSAGKVPWRAAAVTSVTFARRYAAGQ